METVSNPISLSSFQFLLLTQWVQSRHEESLLSLRKRWVVVKTAFRFEIISLFEINEFPYIFEGFPSKIRKGGFNVKTNVFIISFNVFIYSLVISHLSFLPYLPSPATPSPSLSPLPSNTFIHLEGFVRSVSRFPSFYLLSSDSPNHSNFGVFDSPAKSKNLIYLNLINGG